MCYVIGQEFTAAGKRGEVVVQRHPAFLVDLLGVVKLVLDLVPVERHLNDVVSGQGVTLPFFEILHFEIRTCLDVENKFI